VSFPVPASRPALEPEERAELGAWLQLAQTPGVGAETGRKLLSAFGLPQQILAAPIASLRQVVSERVAQGLRQPPGAEATALGERTLAWAEEPGNYLLTLADPRYPPQLLEIADPPLLLYVKGRLELLTQPALAVVGSRNATAQGVLNAEKFSQALSQAGFTIVSGMALGIDTAAHHGALSAPEHGGSTIAVIGTGADIVYPARNRTLAHRIAEAGCIVSEYPLGMPAIAANFPRRNRIISGLARAVLVVEAAAQSGSLITARMAADQGRDVFAIPGSIHSPLSKGCHQLIKQGAKLVESAQDVLEELQYLPLMAAGLAPSAAAAPAADATPIARQLLDALGFDPVTPDLLAMRCGLNAATLAAELLTLELQGQVEALPGGNYRRLG
jgi:DNA processing protein